jgi:hypothetical protein
METTHPSRTQWRKPSRSGSNGNCVEIAATGTMIAVRDSRDPTGRNSPSPRTGGRPSPPR